MITDRTIRLDSEKNPVIAALRFLQCGGVQIDEQSFERVAKLVGDSPDEDLVEGFLISDLQDLDRLCKIGKFVVAFEEGLARAYTPQEWYAHMADPAVPTASPTDKETLQ
jgi:hypothetical protein